MAAATTTTTPSPVKNTEGLSQHEIVALVTIAQNETLTAGYVSAFTIRDDMRTAGFTEIATTLALKTLAKKGLIDSRVLEDENGRPYNGYSATPNGDEWLMANQRLLVLEVPPPF